MRCNDFMMTSNERMRLKDADADARQGTHPRSRRPVLERLVGWRRRGFEIPAGVGGRRTNGVVPGARGWKEEHRARDRRVGGRTVHGHGAVHRRAMLMPVAGGGRHFRCRRMPGVIHHRHLLPRGHPITGGAAMLRVPQLRWGDHSKEEGDEKEDPR